MPTPDNNTINLTIIGGLLVDDIAISSENLKLGSSNPVKWQHRLGGVATNVARVAAQQLDVMLIASTGDDSHGQLLAHLLAERAISSALVVWSGQASDRYTAVLNPDGELYIGLADAQLAEKMRWSDIEQRLPEQRPSAFLLDANLSANCLSDTVTALQTHYKTPPPIYALAVSPAKAVRWLDTADKVDVLLCNRREAAALTNLNWQSDINRMADALMEKLFSGFVITDGSDSILVQDRQIRTIIDVPQIHIAKNVNGAGDAMAAASIVQIIKGQSLAQAVASAGLDAARAVLSGDVEPPQV